jgi:hypothetical protein
VLLCNGLAFGAATVFAGRAARREIQGLVDKHNNLAMAYYELKDYVHWAVTQRPAPPVTGKVIQLPILRGLEPPKDPTPGGR